MELEQFRKMRIAPGDRMVLENGTDHLIAAVDFETGEFESASDGLTYPMQSVARIYWDGILPSGNR